MIRTVLSEENVEDRIRAATYGDIREADCRLSDGVLLLRGRVPNFYTKQLAQEAAGRLPGVVDVINHIEVVSAV